MELYITALSLPRKGLYLPLHKHRSEGQMDWTARDRDICFDLHGMVEQLYHKGPAGLGLYPQLLNALYDESLTSTQAANRILPFYLRCNTLRSNKAETIEEKADHIQVLRMAADPQQPNGIRFVVIGKNTNRLVLQPWALEQISRERGSEFTEEESQTLEGRSDRTLIRLVAEAGDSVALEGVPKIVCVPAEALVNLTRTHRGEFVREVPRVWS